MSRLSKAEIDDIAAKVEHRLRWVSEGHMPEDFPDMVRKLVEHAQATASGPLTLRLTR